jgi:hypothetical protein
MLVGSVAHSRPSHFLAQAAANDANIAGPRVTFTAALRGRLKAMQ